MKHPTWRKSISNTPEWRAWYKYASENQLYDVDESLVTGWMSPNHARDFLKYVRETYVIE